ncbi:hypothetical protein SDC9_168531 [bioreactor metagenome]|uniref:Uncharacterized protein n=1 Tax=bioreactor metagenome TaxID=1076179 RepID=A0A645G5B9_9ZZZZ
MAAGPSYRKYDISAVRVQGFPRFSRQGHFMTFNVNVGYFGLGCDIHVLFQFIRDLQHGLEIRICSQMLYLGLLHMKPVFQAQKFQTVVRHIALLCGAEADQDLIGLFYVINDGFGRKIFGEPAAVFGGYDIFTIGKCSCAGQAFHNGAGFAFDAFFGFLGDDGADAVF